MPNEKGNTQRDPGSLPRVFCTDHDHGAAIHYRLNEPRNVLTNLFMLILSLIVALFYEKGVIISTNEANCIYFNK
jgi:hypothetical protein